MQDNFIKKKKEINLINKRHGVINNNIVINFSPSDEIQNLQENERLKNKSAVLNIETNFNKNTKHFYSEVKKPFNQRKNFINKN